jgi:hypothetical protein
MNEHVKAKLRHSKYVLKQRRANSSWIREVNKKLRKEFITPADKRQ